MKSDTTPLHAIEEVSEANRTPLVLLLLSAGADGKLAHLRSDPVSMRAGRKLPVAGRRRSRRRVSWVDAAACCRDAFPARRGRTVAGGRRRSGESNSAVAASAGYCDRRRCDRHASDGRRCPRQQRQWRYRCSGAGSKADSFGRLSCASVARDRGLQRAAPGGAAGAAADRDSCARVRAVCRQSALSLFVGCSGRC